MLFEVVITKTVQLQPYDFHSQYMDAILRTIREQLFGAVSYEYGRVLAFSVDPHDISDSVLLFPHTGVATFEVPFRALVELPVIGERTLAYLDDFLRTDDDYRMILQLGSIRLEARIPVANYIVRDSETLECVRQNYGTIRKGDFLRIRVTSSNSCQLLDAMLDEDSDEESDEGDDPNDDEYDGEPI
ncbi:DNA-directed RNA polymerase II subunit RPB7 [Giardia muris]|uniref:DNA-directed RNA polymerase II subunit RPB7 n=1 Tax=Giardia muris TaxID=5742 RepID=A0A4Z1SXK7_GIAMU|nr:DNA-directed RNA polymerase II subunit RPB7 [Giardia muris]|eukprot:TNJ30454.1 DNA-directed RNA polymerase II subunit RPB7 [Giardia muris]